MNPITTYDVIKIVGIINGTFSGLILTAIFFWARHVKEDMNRRYKEVKDDMDARYQEVKADLEERYKAQKIDMRDMIRGMHENFEKRNVEKWTYIEGKITENRVCIDALKERYQEHYDKYHSRKE